MMFLNVYTKYNDFEETHFGGSKFLGDFHFVPAVMESRLNHGTSKRINKMAHVIIP